ncbi:hypothetical protein J6590_081783 [Homalodisca vitripennis]|nr:hypothetical protein J6590_081783 [Homalodisca vitripennis]
MQCYKYRDYKKSASTAICGVRGQLATICAVTVKVTWRSPGGGAHHNRVNDISCAYNTIRDSHVSLCLTTWEQPSGRLSNDRIDQLIHFHVVEHVISQNQI